MERRTEIIERVIEIVEEETEIERERILSRDRSLEVVDARHLTVALLAKMGIYTTRIAFVLKLTPRNIQYVLTHFDDRISGNRTLRIMYETIRKRLRNVLETNTL